MESLERKKGERRWEGAAKQKERVVLSHPHRTLAPPANAMIVRAPVNEAKLAALAVDLNIRPRSADMPAVMQERVLRYTRTLLDSIPADKKLNPTHLAMSLKKEFDGLYGPAWHCIAGKSFGSFVTHSSGGFMYYSVGKLSFLLFRTQVRPVLPKRLPQVCFVPKPDDTFRNKNGDVKH